MDVNSIGGMGAQPGGQQTAVKQAQQSATTEPKPVKMPKSVGGRNDEFLVNGEPKEPGKEGRFSTDMIDKAIEAANKKLEPFSIQMNYSVHKVTKDIIVKMVDTETKEVLKEFPPEKNLDAIAKLMELAGIIVDQKR